MTPAHQFILLLPQRPVSSENLTTRVSYNPKSLIINLNNRERISHENIPTRKDNNKRTTIKMMIPEDVFDQVLGPARTTRHTPTHTSPLPFPTVTQDIPKVYHQYSTEVGHKTLWCVDPSIRNQIIV